MTAIRSVFEYYAMRDAVQDVFAWTPSRIAPSQIASWHKAGRIANPGATISTFSDITANSRNWTQGTATAQPAFSKYGFAGKPTLVFDGSNDIMTGANYTGLTGSMDVFFCMQLDNDPPTAGFGAWGQLCSSTGTEDYVPFTDRVVYCGVGSTTRKTVGIIGSAGFWARRRIIAVRSAASAWSFWVDGLQRFSTASNTLNAHGTNAIGGDPENAGYRLDGMFPELLVFSPSLSTFNFRMMHIYLSKEYQIPLAA